MSQKELQRVTVISQCVQGSLTCARAAKLLALSPRHIHRLKAGYRKAEAVMAHASRGRPSHRRLPQRTHAAILRLARSKYAGFNDHPAIMLADQMMALESTIDRVPAGTTETEYTVYN